MLHVSCRSVVDSGTIDDINILQATLLAMTQAVAALPGDTPHHILIDGCSVPKVLKWTQVDPGRRHKWTA